jgi:flagellar L-ring protein FlgH
MKGAETIKRFAVTGAVMLLTACGTVPEHDAGFAPAFPVAAEAPKPTNGAIYQAGFSRNMFEDSRARGVGDLLTVTLTEKTNAQKKASTSTAKDSTISLGTPSIFGAPVLHNGNDILTAGVANGNEFTGDGSSAQSNSLTGSITVFVANVLPNGNLVVRGEKRLTLNTGDEYVRLSGIVRPEDIAPDNTIDSTKVANAEILYSGNGAIADSNRQGWLGRFFNSPLWPF